MSDAQRLRLGVVTAVIVLAFGVSKVASVGWAVAVGVCAVALVAAVAVVGNRLGARRASGN